MLQNSKYIYIKYKTIYWLSQILFPFNKHKRKIYRDNFFLKTCTKNSNIYYELNNIPVFIISFNNLLYLKQMLKWLNKYGFTNIHIVDNQSTYLPLLRFYKNCSVNIHYMDKNYGHTVVWSSGKFDNIINKFPYIVTDPDIAPNKNLPKDFVKTLFNLLFEYQNIVKVGFAIQIDDLPNNKLKKKIIGWEKQFWTTRIKKSPDIYYANIDTTFALYRPGKQKPFSGVFYSGLRVASEYTSKHLPWYSNAGNFYYKKTANKSATWLQESKKS